MYKYIYIYTSDACFRNLLYFTHSWIFFLASRDLYLASAARYQLRQPRVQQGPLPCHLPVRQASRCHHWKTIGSCILRGWDATFGVMMQFSVNRLGGWSSCTSASEPPGGSTNNTGGMVGKIWILLSRAPNFRNVPTKPLRTTATNCMEEGMASSKSCCWAIC